MLNPPLLLVGGLAVAYATPGRRPLRVEAGANARLLRERRRRALAFYAGLASILVAVEPPMDGWADRYFSLHMIQHMLLISVAAPLLVIGAPWLAPWRLLPGRTRRAAARGVVHAAWSRSARRVAHLLTAPATVLVLFVADLWVWHLPAVYDLALRHQPIHDLEHLLFLLTSVLLWAQVLDSPPFRARIENGFKRAGYLTLAMLGMWSLAVFLAYAPGSLYPFYASLHGRGGISELLDQKLAAGVMWGPGSVSFAIADFVELYRWLGQEERPLRGRRGSAAPRPRVVT